MTAGISLRFPAIVSHSEEETALIGCAIAAHISEGLLVLLNGKLGAGKTFLVQSIAGEFGIRGVRSPTFNIEVCHRIADRPFDLVHVDSYRLDSLHPHDEETLRIEEQLADGNLVLIEWAERLHSHVQDEALEINLIPCGTDVRLLELSSYGRTASKLLSSLFPELLDIVSKRKTAACR